MRYYTTIPEKWEDSETVNALEATRWLLETFPESVTLQPHDRLEFVPAAEPRYTGDSDIVRYARIWIDRHTLSSDYVGSFVDRANLVSLMDECPDIVEEWHLDYGGTVGGWEFELDESGDWVEGAEWDGDQFRILVESLDSLESYPILDEQVWTELEQEALGEAWEEAWKSIEREYPLDRIASRCDWVEEPPAGYVWNVDAMIEHAQSGAVDWDILQRFETVEGTQAYVDADELARAMLEWAIKDEREIYKPADWLDPTHPDFHLPGSVGRRAALHNSKVAEIRTEALRCGSNWDGNG